MEILLYALIGLLFISSGLLSFFYLSENKKNKILTIENKKIFDENLMMSKSIEKIKNDINTTNKKGFYKQSVNLTDNKDRSKSEPYEVIVYVSEKERYTNGVSKITLDKIENLSGRDPYQYDWVRKCIQQRFISLKETKDIDWLEPIIPLDKQRVDKINKILEKIKEKENGTE